MAGVSTPLFRYYLFMLSRRGFILSGAAVGGGLVIGYGYVALDDGDATEKFGAAGQQATPLNAWLKIAADGAVTCGIHRAEMGQGITTTIAMLLVEELDADWSDVRFEFVPVDRDYFNFGMLLNGQPLGDPEASWRAATGTWAIREAFHALGMSMTIASSSTVDAWDTLRPAGAAARQMLLAAAARKWNMSSATLRTERGYVYDAANNRKFSYGELAELAGREPPPSSVALKDPANYRLIGYNPPRLDTPMKIDGSAQFGMDIHLPDMLYATVVHSPVAGTNIAGFSSNGADTMPGVHSIVTAGAPGFERAVAVVADSSWQALQAAAKVTVTPAQVSGELVDSDALRVQYRELLETAAPVVFRDSALDSDKDGDEADADPANNADAKTAFDELMLSASEQLQLVTADYEVPFLAHLCMEPMNCTALYTDGAVGAALEIWAPTQANSVARDIAAKMSGLDNSQVTLHTTFIGGGFGRRADMDFVEQAVAVAMQVPNRPVKLFWSREQDVRHDAFRPAASCRITGALDADRNLSLLDYKLVTQSVVASYETRTPTPRGGDASSDKSVVTAVNPPIYAVDNLRVGFTPIDLHMPAGYWRSVSHSWNSFFIESFIDELAGAANMQPLAFRRQALATKPRHLAVLNAVAAQTADSTADGVGFAVTESHTTVVAHAVEVAELDGKFEHVVRVVCAIDCGPVVHPDNVIAQMEGSIVDGLSAALYGQIDIANGEVVQGNFDTYRRMSMAACPTIEVIIIESEQHRPGGVGEPGLPGTAPALTNAIFAATGERIRSLPILN
jgi:isoquinoline 1-oxidoreductase beta subunit